MKKILWISVWLWMCVGACTPKEEPVDPGKVEDEVKKAIVDVMREWYFWNDQLPATVDLSKFPSNEELLDGILYKPLDRFY